MTAFQALPKVGDEADALFCGVPGTPLARVNAGGQIRWQGSGVAHLPLAKTQTLEWLWTHAHPGGLYIAYEATDRSADASSGGLCNFAAPDYRRVWCAAIPAFNVGAAFSDSGALYVTGIGMVARIDRRTGRYLWRVDGLYVRSRAFNVFRVPVEEGPKVVFHASAGTEGVGFRRLVVDAASGNVVADEPVDGAAGLPPDFPRRVRGCAP